MPLRSRTAPPGDAEFAPAWSKIAPLIPPAEAPTLMLTDPAAAVALAPVVTSIEPDEVAADALPVETVIGPLAALSAV